MTQLIQYTIDTACQSYVEGWAISPGGRCTIEVLVDGQPVGTALTGLQRADVGAALPHIPGSAVAGFIYAFGEADFAHSKQDPSISLRISTNGASLETERIAIPARTAGGAPRSRRSCFPSAVTEAVLTRSPQLGNSDLTSAEGALALVEVLEHLVKRGPRPLPGIHRYLRYLRIVSSAAVFAEQYFPKANVRPTGEKDVTGMLTSPMEMLAIAHHLYVLADAGVHGVVLEFGCYKGFSTSVLSTACQLLGRDLHVFDSFKGLPVTDSTHYRPGEFSGEVDEVTRNITEFGHPDSVILHPGFFSESVPEWQPRSVMSLWMDVDLEQSAADALRIFPNVDPRGAVFSHECRPANFNGLEPVPRRGSDDVVGPIADAFADAGRVAAGIFLSGYTGAFWDAHDGLPVLPIQPFERVLAIARR
jgi:O-methyltransferase